MSAKGKGMLLGKMRVSFGRACDEARKGYAITRWSRIWSGAYLVWDGAVKSAGSKELGALILYNDDGGAPCRWSPVPGDDTAKDWITLGPLGHLLIRTARKLKTWAR